MGFSQLDKKNICYMIVYVYVCICMYIYIYVIHTHEHFTEPDTCTLQKSPKYMFCLFSTFLFISNYHSEQFADEKMEVSC